MTEIKCSRCGRKSNRTICIDCSNELSSISKGVNQKQADMAQEVWNAWLHDYEMDNPFYYLTFIPDEHLKSIQAAYDGLNGLLDEYSSGYREHRGFLEIDKEVWEAVEKELKERKNEI